MGLWTDVSRASEIEMTHGLMACNADAVMNMTMESLARQWRYSRKDHNVQWCIIQKTGHRSCFCVLGIRCQWNEFLGNKEQQQVSDSKV